MLTGRRIAFDFGQVRIGVAASDRSGILASPLLTLDASDPDLALRISEIFVEVEPIYVFVGDPKHMSGDRGAKSEGALDFGRMLSTLAPCPVIMIDERLSTVGAMQNMRTSGHNTKSARSTIDEMAAVVILESAMEQERITGKVQGTTL
jgi:putative holliday junction resolvase